VFTRLEKLELQSQTPEQVIFSTDAGPLTVTSPGPGIFRLSFGVAGVKGKNSGDGLIVPQQEAAEQITTEQTKTGFVLKTFFTELAVSGKPLTISLTHRGRERIKSAAKAQTKLPAFGHDSTHNRWCVTLDLPEDQAVYGLGEQTDALGRRGQTVVQRAADASGADITVVPGLVPLAWSPRGWGVLTVCQGAQQHAVAAPGAESIYAIEGEGETLDVFLFGGTPADVLNSYTNLTGKPVAPPLWGLGAWVSRAHYDSAADALESVKQLREHGIACDVVLLDNQPSLEVRSRMGFDWDPVRVAEPLKLLTAIKSHRVQPVAMESPRVALDSPVAEELSVKNWLLRDLIDETTGLVDLTHPDAYTFWRDKHESRFKEGLAAIATCLDAPELEKLESSRGGNGRRLANLYPRLFNRAAHEAAQRFNGDGIDKRAMVWNLDQHPAPFVGSHRAPVQHISHGAGWAGLAQAVRGGASAGQCAVTAFATTVGGSGVIDAELYIRWLSASAFFPHLHFGGVDVHAPWSFDAQTTSLAKNWLKFRYRLIPYLMGALEESGRNGLPLMRSMALAFPDDEQAHAHDLQFLCGPALLVAPITTPGGKTTVYFPRGERWHDLATGNKYEGGTRFEFECGLDSLPVFGREGHILCLGNECESTVEINTIRPAVEAWLFGLPAVDPCVTAVKVKVMQMQGNAYIKGLEGTKVLAAWGYEVSRRGAEVKVVKKR
jgi:alpha-glucosidase (family GH31 glycosyl hydrolase)